MANTKIEVNITEALHEAIRENLMAYSEKTGLVVTDIWTDPYVTVSGDVKGYGIKIETESKT